MALADYINMETVAGPAPAAPKQPQGRMVRGTGGGLADANPTMIDGEVPAEISENEFIVPADVVAMLGDGSSEAGARILQGIIDKVRAAKQGGDTKQAESLSTLLG